MVVTGTAACVGRHEVRLEVETLITGTGVPGWIIPVRVRVR